MPNPTQFEELALARLKSATYRITMPRVLVVRALASSQIALDPYGIHRKINAEGGKIDVVSVYRILATLSELGLVYQVGLLGGKYFRREATSDAKHRMIFASPDTDRVVEAPCTISATALSEIAEKQGLKLTGFQLEIEVRGL